MADKPLHCFIVSLYGSRAGLHGSGVSPAAVLRIHVTLMGIQSFHFDADLEPADPAYLTTIIRIHADPYSRYLFTWRDESIPPCRRVSDTSRHRCGRPLLLRLVHLGFHSSFPPWIGSGSATLIVLLIDIFLNGSNLGLKQHFF